MKNRRDLFGAKNRRFGAETDLHRGHTCRMTERNSACLFNSSEELWSLPHISYLLHVWLQPWLLCWLTDFWTKSAFFSIAEAARLFINYNTSSPELNERMDIHLTWIYFLYNLIDSLETLAILEVLFECCFIILIILEWNIILHYYILFVYLTLGLHWSRIGNFSGNKSQCDLG